MCYFERESLGAEGVKGRHELNDIIMLLNTWNFCKQTRKKLTFSDPSKLNDSLKPFIILVKF